LITIKNDKNKEYTFKSLDEIFKTFISEEEMTKRYLEIPPIFSEYDIIKNMIFQIDSTEVSKKFELNIERLKLINQIFKSKEFQSLLAFYQDDKLSHEESIINILSELHSKIMDNAQDENLKFYEQEEQDN
jgi:hypothetical protein